MSGSVAAEPIDKGVWHTKECAAFFSVSVAYFRSHFAARPDFPRPMRFAFAGSRGRLMWVPEEVRAWRAKNMVRTRT